MTYVIFTNTKKNSPWLSVICCCITSYPNVLWLKITTIDAFMIWHSGWSHTEVLAYRSCSLTWPQSSDSSTGMNQPNCLGWRTLLLLHWPPTLWKASLHGDLRAAVQEGKEGSFKASGDSRSGTHIASCLPRSIDRSQL